MMADLPEHDRERAKYAIAMVVELTGVPAQQLRRWESVGLITPARSSKGTRRYSDADLQRIRQIMTLAANGVNQAGIEQILLLQRDLAAAETRAHVAEGQARAAQDPTS
jgi:DNA-binding transcriptional MerR regulator